MYKFGTILHIHRFRPRSQTAYSVSADGSLLYMFGGVETSNNRALPSIQEFRRNGPGVQHLTSGLPASFLAVAVTLTSGKVFITGGKNSERKAFLLEVTKDAVEWTECADMKYERIGHAGACIVYDQEELVIVAGGWNSQKRAQDTVEKYSFESNSWRSLSRLPQPRAYFALQVFQNKYQ